MNRSDVKATEASSAGSFIRAKIMSENRVSLVWLGHLTAYALMVLWFHTGYDKIQDINAFEVSISRQPLPGWSVGLLTYTVPLAEFATGLLLIAPCTRRIGYWLSAVMMAGFTLYVGLGLAGALGHLPCSCSKIISHLSWGQHLVFNVVYLAVALAGLAITYPVWTAKRYKHIKQFMNRKKKR